MVGVRSYRQGHRVVTPEVVGSSPTAPAFFWGRGEIGIRGDKTLRLVDAYTRRQPEKAILV